MSSLGKLMKQAARMQQQMEQIQTTLAQRTVEATTGGGAVKVVAKCDGTIASIKINPEALNPADAQLRQPRHLHHHAEAGRMMIATGNQCGSCWRAESS